MGRQFLRLVCLLAVVAAALADCYEHNPRGSNNRLSERSANRNNANRLFDSQNNNRGGYNVGDVDDEDGVSDENTDIYYMKYFQSAPNAETSLVIEWTNQHGCGGNEDTDPHKLNCNIVIQYMVMEGDEDIEESNAHYRIHDGTTTNTQNHQTPNRGESYNNYVNRRDNSVRADRGLHEPFDYYDDCYVRQRNEGLFTADQNLRSNKFGVRSAIYTRQNPNGNRRGYECPEERDYYPYWGPTPWRDIAILTNDVSRCRYYRSESQNVKARGHCVDTENILQTQRRDEPVFPITKDECEATCFESTMTSNGTCLEWVVEELEAGLSAPECVETQWSRDNHLGNTMGGYPIYYNWTIPNTPHEHCVLRIRYNISTADYDPWNDPNVNSSLRRQNKDVYDGDDGLTRKRISPLDVYSRYGFDNLTHAAERGYVFRQNPVVQVFSGLNFGLQLAINTNQFGRTFQDRSHTFAIRERPDSLRGETIYNLSVRGKRGNIVQVYPAVEYDFVPNVLFASRDSYIHIQWSGSNTNPNNNDGQGRAGTDRNNMILLRSPNYPEGDGRATANSPTYGHLGNSYPAHLDDSALLGLSRADRQALAVLDNLQFGGEMSELDDAGTYFDLGPRKVTERGTYYYMCTRNNNFSNRSQKGKIIVQDNALSTARIGAVGGMITLEGHYVEIGANDLDSAVMFQMEEFRDPQDAVDMAEGQGGSSIDKPSGDRYSPYVSLQPYTTFAEAGQEVTIAIDLHSGAPSDVKLYVANPRTNWNFVEMRTSTDDGRAMASTSEGGVFVATAEQDLTWIAGVVVAFVVIVVIVLVVVAVIVYFKLRPEKWAKTKDNVKKAKIRVTRSFATKV